MRHKRPAQKIPPYGGWTFTKHALQRALEMAVDPWELSACLQKPARVDPHAAIEGREARAYGRLVLITDPSTRTVITVLWACWFYKGRGRRGRYRDDVDLSKDQAA